MSKRNKLSKFADVYSYPNVFENFQDDLPLLHGENGEKVMMKGKWDENYFKNQQEIVLELACGRGEYTLGMSERYPTKNFIGVDIKGARIWKGATNALSENRTNVAFLRTRIEQLGYFFGNAEVDEIWITFPDPFYKKENRRLTSPHFLKTYKKILKPGAMIHLKTDARPLYEYSLEVLEADPNIRIYYHSDDIYAAPLINPVLEIKTYYEKQHLANNKKITYIQFGFISDNYSNEVE